MKNNYADMAENYYRAMAEKDISRLEKYLHPDIQFTTPLIKSKGKEAYLEALKGFMAFFTTLTIRAKLQGSDQAMIVYDVSLPQPIGNLPSAALLSFSAGLISSVELFYDARAFVK